MYLVPLIPRLSCHGRALSYHQGVQVLEALCSPVAVADTCGHLVNALARVGMSIEFVISTGSRARSVRCAAVAEYLCR